MKSLNFSRLSENWFLLTRSRYDNILRLGSRSVINVIAEDVSEAVAFGRPFCVQERKLRRGSRTAASPLGIRPAWSTAKRALGSRAARNTESTENLRRRLERGALTGLDVVYVVHGDETVTEELLRSHGEEDVLQVGRKPKPEDTRVFHDRGGNDDFGLTGDDREQGQSSVEVSIGVF